MRVWPDFQTPLALKPALCQMTQLLKYLELIATYNEKDRAPVRGGQLV
jgi:hypothetical protein